MPRPKKKAEDRLSHQVGVRLDEATHRRLAELAARRGVGLPEAARALLDARGAAALYAAAREAVVARWQDIDRLTTDPAVAAAFLKLKGREDATVPARLTADQAQHLLHALRAYREIRDASRVQDDSAVPRMAEAGLAAVLRGEPARPAMEAAAGDLPATELVPLLCRAGDRLELLLYEPIHESLLRLVAAGKVRREGGRYVRADPADQEEQRTSGLSSSGSVSSGGVTEAVLLPLLHRFFGQAPPAGAQPAQPPPAQARTAGPVPRPRAGDPSAADTARGVAARMREQASRLQDLARHLQARAEHLREEAHRLEREGARLREEAGELEGRAAGL
jgi:hypothetical protein